MRILYVEDNPGDADLLERQFRKSAPHIEVERASTCHEALDKLQVCLPDHCKYDLILTDMHLPDGNGISLLPIIHQKELNLPVVVLTGMGSEESVVAALKAGAVDYVIKRDDYLSRLPETLERALHTYRGSPDLMRRSLSVLYGESNLADVDLTYHHFARYAPFVHLDIVSSAEGFLNRLTGNTEGGDGQKKYDVLLIDHDLSGMDGLELLRELREVHGVDNPAVIIAGQGDENLAIRAFRLGAMDYVTKNVGYLYQLPGVLENVVNRVIIERERAALRESEEYFRLVTENATDVISVCDAQGVMLYVSPSGWKLLGYPPATYAGRNAFDYMDPAMVPSAREWAAKATRNPGLTLGPIEINMRHREGHWICVEGIGKSIKDPKTGQVVIVFNSRDMTEHKRAEKALALSEKQYRSFFDASPIALAEIDGSRPKQYVDSLLASGVEDLRRYLNERPDGVKECASWVRIVKANRACVDLFGASDEAALVTGIPLVPEADVDFIINGLVAIGEGRTSFEDERTIVRSDGDRRSIYLRWTVAPGYEETHERVLNCMVDITDRKRMEEALIESEGKYRGVVENALVGAFIIQDDYYRFVNGRFCEIHGYDREEIVNKLRPMDLCHPDYTGLLEEHRQQYLAGEAFDDELDLIVIRKDGKSRTVKVLRSAMIYKGRPAIVGTIMDITKEKALESRLHQAQKMEAVGTLAGGIAHDFNNLLTVLTGYGTLLRMGMEDENPLRLYVDQILSASEKAANLTKSLLAFSRQHPVALHPVSINAIVRGTRKLLKQLLTEDIVLKTLLTDDETTVMADVTQIDQILFNLATNARDAMPRGGMLAIETSVVDLNREFVKLHGLDSAGRYVLLSISDTGVGMDKAVCEKIFDPFFTTKEVGKGTGLGLATVYGVVKQHLGHIAVYSEPAIGTTFHIYLPVVKTELDEAEIPQPPLKGGNESILIAEDNESVRRLMRDILKEYGYRVTEAVDGQDAVEKFKRLKGVDLMIIDSVMPKKNGREVYDEVRALRPGIKALFTSGYTRDVILDKGIEENNFEFIPKPLSPANLLIKVREVLDKEVGQEK